MKQSRFAVLLMMSLMFFLSSVGYSKNTAPEPGGSVQKEIVFQDTPVISVDTILQANPVEIDTALINAIINYSNSAHKDPEGFLGVGWNWLYTLYLFVYLLIGLLFPTVKEYDFVLWPLKIVQWLIANRKADGGTHVKTIWQTLRKQ